MKKKNHLFIRITLFVVQLSLSQYRVLLYKISEDLENKPLYIVRVFRVEACIKQAMTHQKIRIGKCRPLTFK